MTLWCHREVAPDSPGNPSGIQFPEGNVQHHTLFLPPSGHCLRVHSASPQRQLPGSSCQLLVSVWARALPAAHCSPFSLLQAASSVTAALEDFVKPEQLDGENCFKCSKCDKMVAASKRFTVHCAPKVLTVCLKRFEGCTGRKISKVCMPLEGNFLFPEQEISQSSTLFHKLFMLGFSCALPRRGEFWWEDKRVLCSDRAALAGNSFLPAKPCHVEGYFM
ncbi:uncharacterized protein ACIBXB_005640 [Morphnus guianensis]